MESIAPWLCKVVSARVKKRRTVAQALHGGRWLRDISGSLSVAAIVDYLKVWDRMSAVQLNQEREDNFIWRWTPNGNYSACSAYKMLHHGSVPFAGHDLIWKTWAALKVKLFLWTAFRQRLWTADRHRRHNLDTHSNCPLCYQEPETGDHMLVACSFALQVWWSILSALNITPQAPSSDRSLLSWWSQLRAALPSHKRPGLDSLVALTA